MRTLLLVAALLGTAAAEACPEPCACLGGHVDCSGRGLTRLPPALPSWTQTLELQSNRIANLSDSVLPLLPALRKLDLRRNGLGELEASFFTSFASVQELDLRNNALSSLPPGLRLLPNLTVLRLRGNALSSGAGLGGLRHLQTLDLGRNRLSAVPSLGGEPSALKELLLDGNRLESLSSGDFAGLGALETLRLSRNRLAALPRTAFAALDKLRSLDLSRNRLRLIGGVAFGGLSRLRSLRLAKNGLRRLDDGAFWGLPALRELSLAGNSLTEVRRGWLYGLSNLTKLSLSGNRVTGLEPSGWAYAGALETLDLGGNALTSLPAGAFEGLRNLRRLELSGNELSRLSHATFNGLQSLKELDLSGNALAPVLEDRLSPFVGLRALEELSLANNTLRTLSDVVFKGLGSVHILDLRGNPLSTLSAETFAALPTLTSLRASSSALACDCGLDWVRPWLRSAALLLPEESLACAHPDGLRGQLLLTLDPALLSCSDSPKPVLGAEPADVTGLSGTDAAFACAATARPPLSVLWKRNGQKVFAEEGSLEISNTKTPASTNESEEIHSELRLRNLRQDDAESRWQCVVSNSFGSAYSRSANLQVHVFPSFVLRPANATVGVGQSARLECSAVGYPPPQISWQKDGGLAFPAAAEQRMHLMERDDVSFIVQAKAVDEGRYTCTAASAAGAATAHAWLTVQEERGSESTLVGQTAVLRCPVAEAPPPPVTWFKDGAALPQSERRELSAGGQLLVIASAAKADSGAYACSVGDAARKPVARLAVRALGESALFGSATEPNRPWDEADPGLPAARPKDRADAGTAPGLVIMLVVGCIVGTSLIWVAIIWACLRRRRAPPSKAPEKTPVTEVPATSPLLQRPPDILSASWLPPPPTGTAERRPLDRSSENAGYSSGSDSLRRNRRRVVRTRALPSTSLLSTLPRDELGCSFREEPPSSLDSGVQDERRSPDRPPTPKERR